MNALDVAAIRFPEQHPRCPQLIASARKPLPEKLRQQILDLQEKEISGVQQATREHEVLGRLFSQTISGMIGKHLDPGNIRAIGLHGQTVLHRPNSQPPFSLQIGDPHIVAAQTKCSTVSDFRQADMENGGQGAPLAPAFHQAFFARRGQTQAVVNIGGIANLTWLESDGSYRGYDCGPGNILMDAWSRLHLDEPCDRNGDWAKSGTCDEALLARMLDDAFFRRKPPKSACATGFSLGWLEQKTGSVRRMHPENVQSCLAELTARCIASEILASSSLPQRVLVCGGGAHNDYLMQRLRVLLGKIPVDDTLAAGIPADWVEAAGFACLARQRLNNVEIDLRSTTGAHKTALLGKIYYPGQSGEADCP